MRRMPVGIVTGASRGLGLALARALDERGWELVVDARGARRARRGRPPASTASPRSPATSPIPSTARALVEAAGDRIDLRREQRQPARAEPACRALADYPLDALRAGLRGERARAARAASSSRCRACAEGAAVARHHLRRRRRGLRGLGRLRLVEGRARAAHRDPRRRAARPARLLRSTPATCARRCTRTPSRARTSPTARRPRRACPACSP